MEILLFLLVVIVLIIQGIINARLGRLQIRKDLGDIDGDGDVDRIVSYGGRGFTIWAADGSRVWDSGDLVEQGGHRGGRVLRRVDGCFPVRATGEQRRQYGSEHEDPTERTAHETPPNMGFNDGATVAT
jgi:hypothetical protein